MRKMERMVCEEWLGHGLVWPGHGRDERDRDGHGEGKQEWGKTPSRRLRTGDARYVLDVCRR